MSDTPRQSDREFFEDKYGRRRSDAARAVETEALGRAVGLSGFTTIQQAHDLASALNLCEGGRLLDVGAGRGWPGNLIARVTRSRLTSTDVPWSALVAGREELADIKLRHPAHHAATDVLSLPFADATFDAISHADVFC